MTKFKRKKRTIQAALEGYRSGVRLLYRPSPYQAQTMKRLRQRTPQLNSDVMHKVGRCPARVYCPITADELERIRKLLEARICPHCWRARLGGYPALRTLPPLSSWDLQQLSVQQLLYAAKSAT